MSRDIFRLYSWIASITGPLIREAHVAYIQKHRRGRIPGLSKAVDRLVGRVVLEKRPQVQENDSPPRWPMHRKRVLVPGGGTVVGGRQSISGMVHARGPQSRGRHRHLCRARAFFVTKKGRTAKAEAMKLHHGGARSQVLGSGPVDPAGRRQAGRFQAQAARRGPVRAQINLGTRK